jgi:acetyltransferase-like isoleucine patch superfamily enzyme
MTLIRNLDFNYKFKTGLDKMRGREQFRRYRLLIRIVEAIINRFPRVFIEILWTTIDSWRGKLGLVLRYIIARNLAKNCGDVVYIGPYSEIRKWENLVLGSNISINRGAYIDAEGGITIGDNVSIAHGSSILSSNHQWSDNKLPIRDNSGKSEPVYISDNVWIGCGCRIMAGVTIEKRTVVAAGAVVTKDVSEGTLVGGVPARFIKDI